MSLLTTEYEIKAAIAMMNPVANDACQMFTTWLLTNPSLLEDQAACNEACVEACIAAMQRHGWDPEDEARIKNFFDNHAQAVMNVGVSILVKIVNDAEARRKWGWVGTAAAAAAGIVIGSIFG
jgi:hypothetical protein